MGYFRMQNPALPAGWGFLLLQGARRMEGPSVLHTHLCETFSAVLCCRTIITALRSVCRLAGGVEPLRTHQTLARWLLEGSCPPGCMLVPIHPMGILPVGPMPVAAQGLGAAPLPPMLLGRDGGSKEQGEGRAASTGQAMGVRAWHLAVVVGRAPNWLQQPAGARQ